MNGRKQNSAAKVTRPEPKPIGKVEKVKKPQAAAKRVNFSQSDFPRMTLQQSQRIPVGLVENCGGEASPPDVAIAIGVSPTSSSWAYLTGSSVAYGLTEGGINANTIKLTSLGRRLVEPQEEGDDVVARREAVLRPRIAREFFEKYRRQKFPTNETIAENVLKGMGLPADRAKSALSILKANGQYAGIIRETSTGLLVNLESPTVPSPAATSSQPEGLGEAMTAGGEEGPAVAVAGSTFTAASVTQAQVPDQKNSRVFITHGKQRGIANQIKELIGILAFEPIISVERESTAIPVSEKVFEDMRSCGSGVLHVGAEGVYTDRDGKEHPKINDNVLIEVGAAMALYGKKITLLVERGVTLPSNLQGLYRCDYEGDKLDHEATMKLLKTVSQFR